MRKRTGRFLTIATIMAVRTIRDGARYGGADIKKIAQSNQIDPEVLTYQYVRAVREMISK